MKKLREVRDEHINWANYQLKKQFPVVSGFFDPRFVQGLSFPTCRDPFVPLFIHVGNHWMTVAGVSHSEAWVYDSILHSLSTSTKAQIATIKNPIIIKKVKE